MICFARIYPADAFAAEDKCPGVEALLRMFFDLIVQIHNMENVEQLSLILVETFYLHVENGSGIYFYAVECSRIYFARRS